MAVTAKLYEAFPENLGGGNSSGEGPMDLLSDTIKVTLHTSSNGISQTADTVFADLTNQLTTAGGYTSGGATLGTKTYAASSLVTTFDAADTVWTASTFTAAQAQVWDDTVSSPADPLISYVDFGGDQSPAGVDFSILWHASGIFTITVA
jgi:hypothetical protein